jgi:hypothetical protein
LPPFLEANTKVLDLSWPKLIDDLMSASDDIFQFSIYHLTLTGIDTMTKVPFHISCFLVTEESKSLIQNHIPTYRNCVTPNQSSSNKLILLIWRRPTTDIPAQEPLRRVRRSRQLSNDLASRLLNRRMLSRSDSGLQGQTPMTSL